MHKKFIKILSFILFVIASVSAQTPDSIIQKQIRPGAEWEMDYQIRLKALVENRYPWGIENGNADPDAGKRAWPALMANMWHDRADSNKIINWINTKGRDLIFSSKAGTFYKPFSCPGYSQYYFHFKPLLPAAQVNQARKMIDDTGWEYMTRPDGQMDPLYSITEFNSENFNWMARLAGYLWAHELNEPDKIKYFDDYVQNWVRAIFNAGRVEWDSNIYFAYCFQPVLVLHEYAKEEKVKRQARAVLDWMLLAAALHYLDGFQVGPDVRAKTNAYLPFNGSTWFYSYLYFVDKNYHPSFAPEKAIQNSANQYVGFPPYSSYRPPQVVIDIAQRKYQFPVEMHNAKPFYHLDNENYKHWKGDTPDSRRFEFETLYLEKNYTLGSLATYRPDGNAYLNPNGHIFSEQSVWRLGVKGLDNGTIQVFGNAGDDNDMAGRCPYEEIGQYRNVMMRLIKGTQKIWTALPKDKVVDIHGDTLFADLGHEVYLAIIPFQFKLTGNQNFSASHQRYNWTQQDRTPQLGALIFEVGTGDEHGSYSKFKKNIATKTKLTHPSNDQLIYQSTAGRKLKMEFMPTTSYELVDGTIIRPAGVVPKVWCDGKYIDYEKWNVYEVIFGEKIVDQKWGEGQLTTRVNGNGMQISVKDANAEVTYKIIGETKTGSNQKSNLPTGFSLKQNYPNSFNDSTITAFEVPQSCNISIKIFDLMGGEIVSIFKGQVSKGLHKIHWKAQNIAGGIYFCQLEGENFSETRKLIYLN